MKKFVTTLKNIWGIEELRNRIMFTILLLFVYRLGSHIVLPGIDPNALSDPSGQNGLLGMINMFAGGAFNNASIFALGIMPYITASIAMQLAQIAIPKIQKMQKEESGRKKIQMYTRYLTVAVTLVQAIGYITYLRGQNGQAIFADGPMWVILTVIILVTGTLFVMWMGEKITDRGIGNGTSLLIMAGIIARFPQNLIQEGTAKIEGAGGGGILLFLIELVVMVLVVMLIVMLSQAVRRIPINYARRMVGASAGNNVGGARDFIPLKVNSAGVMPIIFAQAIMFLPGILAGQAEPDSFMGQLADFTSLPYNLVYFIMVVAFTYLYTAIIMNPQQMSDDLKRNNGFIPGIKPGSDTANFIGMILDRITLPGAIFLAFVGIFPGIAAYMGVSQAFAQFYGGTSMLIAVQVILDTLQQIESQLLMRHYDGLMETGRIGGRQSNAPVSVPRG